MHHLGNGGGVFSGVFFVLLFSTFSPPGRYRQLTFSRTRVRAQIVTTVGREGRAAMGLVRKWPPAFFRGKRVEKKMKGKKGEGGKLTKNHPIVVLGRMVRKHFVVAVCEMAEDGRNNSNR